MRINKWYKFKKERKCNIVLRLLHDKSTRRGNAAPRSIHVYPYILVYRGNLGTQYNIMVSRAAWRIAGFVTAAFAS